MNLLKASLIIALISAVQWLTAEPVTASLPTTQPGPNAAHVSGVPGNSIKDIMEVRIVAIDGRNISARAHLWLEPGTYELTVLIDVDSTQSAHPGAAIRRNLPQDPSQNKIEVALEAGFTYEIRALYHRESRENPYTVVVHEVKPTRR